AAALGGVAYVLLPAREHSINDVTTDTKTPPSFLAKVHAATIDHGAELLQDLPVVDRSYHAEFAARQAGLYPDIRAIRVRTKEARPVFDLILQQMEREVPGLKIVASDPEKLLIEATGETGFFRLVADVAIRLTPANPKDPDPAVVVDVRSRGRVGPHDLGVSVARIREVSRGIRNITSALAAETNKNKKTVLPATGTSATPKIQ
ncbi:MAG: DUF1499 domain-containing protein, partial [Bdellovibrionales bacterium]|nr:DUF1499 domain-containing protein [Bdellovibrionales bacterium]